MIHLYEKKPIRMKKELRSQGYLYARPFIVYEENIADV